MNKDDWREMSLVQAQQDHRLKQKREGISGHLQIHAKMNKDDWREMSLAHAQ
jgi:hypothetical protein